MTHAGHGPKLPDGKPATDEQIEAAIAEAGVNPEMCEWSDGAYGAVDFRLNGQSMGRYATAKLDPFDNHDGYVHWITRAAERLERRDD